MARVVLRILIHAPPEAIWPVISDLRGQEHWMEDVHSLSVRGEGPVGYGTLVDVTSEIFRLPVVHDVMEITTWDPPRELGVLHRGQFTGSAYFRLEAVDEGTVFTWLEEFQPPFGLLGDVVFSLVVGPHLKRVWGHSMENVRRIVESGSMS